ncbi:type I restriction endonuclease subunit R [Thermopolyspora sp. NPDC052614]|uniref:type I restriction endonuclease subunit R n=1 Tax=Thermopolyspora sp. NPDC052614 TaxID=3155682 RepID=UPI00341E8E81
MKDLSEAQWEALALDILGELGWRPVSGISLNPGSGERASWSELILRGRLREAIVKLNPELPPSVVEDALQRVVSPASQHGIAENKRIHDYMVGRDSGLRITYTDGQGIERTPTIRLIDLREPYDNDFVVANQVTVRQGEHHRRFDIVLFCNGLPVAVVELKKAGAEGADLRGAHAQLMRYVAEFPLAFSATVAGVVSDGITAAYGTPFTPFEHFTRWNVDDKGEKVTDRLDADENLPLNLLLHGLFDQERFVKLVDGYVTFAHGKSGLIKRIAKPHQYFVVEEAVVRTVEAVRTNGLGGVVWHTQGSGKSMEMELYANQVMRHPALGNPTILVLTDRTDLDDQLWGTFAASELLPEKAVQASTREELRAELTGRTYGGIIFSTLQKFGKTKAEKEAGAKHPLLSDRNNIVVIVDEAHRSHYDDLDGYARHLRDALPHATMIAFTGTPISKEDRNTRQVFGDYIRPIYDLTRAVDDGTTVPVYYESRLIPVTLPADVDPDEIDERADEAMAGMDDSEKERIRRNVQVINAVYGADDRVRTLAEDIVAHWDERATQMEKFIGVRGKAMIVCATREICADVYDRIISLKRDWHTDDDATGKIKAVYTGSSKDTAKVAKHVRRKSQVSAIQARMKNPDDGLEIVIVQSMWLTGFDAPPLHTLYVDRPMKDAQLMQTLARVNRRFRGKQDGLLVGYAPLSDNLMRAIAEYTDEDRQRQPLGRDIDRAVDEVKNQHAVIEGILHGYPWRRRLAARSPKAFIHAVTGAVEFLRNPANTPPDAEHPLGARFTRAATKLERLWALCSRSTDLSDFRDDIAFFVAVRVWMAKFDAEERRARGLPIPADVELYLRQLTASAIEADGVTDIYAAAGIDRPNLSTLNDDFIRRMRQARNPHLAIEALRRLIEGKMREVTRNNIVRQQSFSDKLMELMRKYTNQNLTAAQIIEELVRLARDVATDADRGKNFNPELNPDELAFYDAVAANESAVSVMGEGKLADIARDLVRIVKKDVKTDWVYRDDVRAKVRSTIKRLLARHGYPPDAQQEAIALVISQMETIAAEHTK